MMMLKRLRNEEHGAVAVITAILMVLLVFCVALSLDVGGLLLRKREMVNGSDAAAHAAALTYIKSGNLTAACNTADQYYKDNSPGSVNNGGWTRVKCELVVGSTQAQGTIKVAYRSAQPLYFAPVMGFGSTHDVTAAADASWKADGVITGGVPHPINGTDRRVYVCKYVGTPPGQRLSLTASGWRDTNSVGQFGGGIWNGDLGFNDAHDSYVIASVPKTKDQYTINPATDCPQPGPHVWLSN